VARPPLPEVLDRLATRSSVDLGGRASDLLRTERSARRVS
jgi:hypothetical protein